VRTQEALREADRRKDEFLATLAHELRNPVAPIRTAVHVLTSPATGEEQREHARAIIERQARHLTRLVDDLLDVSRLTLGRIALIARAEEEGAVICVSDDGIGIPAGALPHVFERFYRVEAVEHSTVQGLGIGLYIARTLVEAHGGQLTATSMPGRGSTFTVSLPLSA
jgi:signal transduction histidine kinase